MFEHDHQILERLAYEAWLRRGKPVGSPEVDWDEACRQLEAQQFDQEPPPSAPGSMPTNLGAVPPPERSHDVPRNKLHS
jgi:hypothetical protein